MAKLSDEESDLFYSVWWRLLRWVNEQTRLVPALLGPGQPPEIDQEDAFVLRNKLWEDDGLRTSFLERHGAELSPRQRALVESWAVRKRGTLYIFRHLKAHSIVLGDDEGYAVLGLKNTLEEIFPMPLPVMVEMTLLPFEGRIVPDSLFRYYRVTFGPGTRARFKRSYDDFRERGLIRKSLEPTAQKPSVEVVAATNDSVIDAYARHLRKKGLSDEVIARDTRWAGWLASECSPRSLREATAQDVRRVVNSASLGHRPDASVVPSLKRLFAFLRDTERMSYDEALSVLEVLKEETSRRAAARRR